MKHASSAQITTEQQLDARPNALRVRKGQRARLERIDEYFRAGVVIFLAIGLAVAALFLGPMDPRAGA